MKKVVGFFLIGMFFLVILGCVSGLDSSMKVDYDVKLALSEDDSVRVFIEFREDDLMNENKREVIERLGEEKIVHEFVDEVSAVVSKSDILDLELDFNVESVELVGFRKIFLQDSVPLINASPSFSLKSNDLNLTGKDQTICVIDTGVDYNHPSLGGCFGDGCKVVGGWDFVNDDNDPMDDKGHGTHVAGIISANGGITGVAPDSNIVSLKACNSAGSCSVDDLNAAIDWCVNNASKYNISVISMSLGGGTYSTYCNNDPIAPYINNAVFHNISVVVAAGNDNSIGFIASPACVENATPVGALTKIGETVGFDRNNLLQLIAPGYNINSTNLSNIFDLKSGTSMATPHVAGAYAILYQYLNLTSRYNSPFQMESVFNITGKSIFDSGSNLSFSRINVYDAIIFSDEDSPNVSLVSPEDSFLGFFNESFSCNATDLSLSNVTFYLWNSTSIVNETSFNVSGAYNLYNINISNLENTTYEWNCLYGDEHGNSAFAENNFTLHVGDIFSDLNFPVNNSYFNYSNISFSCESFSSNNYELENVTFSLYNLTSLLYNVSKNISGFENNSYFNYTVEDEGDYFWNCLSYNNYSSFDYSSNFSVFYDITLPNVSLVSPTVGAVFSSGAQVEFSFNLSSNDIESCDLIFDGNSVMSNDSVVYGENSFLYTVVSGDYSWRVDCVDFADNIGISSLRNFSVEPSSDLSSGDSGGGGGGGGGVSDVVSAGANSIISVPVFSIGGFTIKNELLSEGSIFEFKIKDAFSNEIDDHSLQALDVSGNSVNMVLRSDPLFFSLYAGEEKRFNLTSGDSYDFYVKLENIFNGSANLTMKVINESIVREYRNIFDEDLEELEIDKVGFFEVVGIFFGSNYFYLMGVVFILVILVFLIRKFFMLKLQDDMPMIIDKDFGEN